MSAIEAPRKSLHWIGAALVVSIVMAAGPALAKEKRLSLNPYGSRLDNDATFVLSQSQAPIVLPAEFRPTFWHGFTIPDDYVDGPLTVELLVESDATACSFHLRPDAMFRMRLRELGDAGNAFADFLGEDASTTPWGIVQNGVVFAAADVAGETVRVRFEITDDESDHAFAPGDAIHFGLFRETNGNYDTCSLPLHVGGMSVVYSDRRILTGPGGFKKR